MPPTDKKMMMLGTRFGRNHCNHLLGHGLIALRPDFGELDKKFASAHD